MDKGNIHMEGQVIWFMHKPTAAAMAAQWCP